MNQRVALITGASQGLGLALAEALADRGWTLVIDARRADRLEPAAVGAGRAHERRVDSRRRRRPRAPRRSSSRPCRSSAGSTCS